MDREAAEGRAGPGSPRPLGPNEWPGVQAWRQDGAPAAAAFVGAALAPAACCARPTALGSVRVLWKGRDGDEGRGQRVGAGEEGRRESRPAAAEPAGSWKSSPMFPRDYVADPEGVHALPVFFTLHAKGR